MTPQPQPSLFDAPAVERARERALRRVSQGQPSHFSEHARRFVLRYLAIAGPTSGEELTLRAKLAGIIPRDDRAFGGVYHVLARTGQIVRVGTCQRMRGNGTGGGSIWALAARQEGQ